MYNLGIFQWQNVFIDLFVIGQNKRFLSKLRNSVPNFSYGRIRKWRRLNERRYSCFNHFVFNLYWVCSLHPCTVYTCIGRDDEYILVHCCYFIPFLNTLVDLHPLVCLTWNLENSVYLKKKFYIKIENGGLHFYWCVRE